MFDVQGVDAGKKVSSGRFELCGLSFGEVCRSLKVQSLNEGEDFGSKYTATYIARDHNRCLVLLSSMRLSFESIGSKHELYGHLANALHAHICIPEVGLEKKSFLVICPTGQMQSAS